MIPIKVSITRKGLGFTAGEWRPILRQAWDHAAKYWHRSILPKHFTTAGAAEYRYAPRTAKYMRAKARTQGHQRPLVWTGETERMAKRWRDIRPSSKGVRIVLRAPGYIWMAGNRGGGGGSSWGSGQPNLPVELMTVSEADATALARVMDRFIERRASQATGGIRDLTRGHRPAA